MGHNFDRCIRERYLTSVVDKAGDKWPESGSVEDKWLALRSALLESADETLQRQEA